MIIKYTINAYNPKKMHESIITVYSPNENEALKKAKVAVTRKYYNIIEAEELKS